ncbi:hypothetical protein VPH35_111117 [Triticum aestivum]
MQCTTCMSVSQHLGPASCPLLRFRWWCQRPDPVLGELLFPLGRGRFSSVHFRSVDAEPESKLGKPSVVHGTYSIVKENFDDAIIMKQQRQVYKVADRSCPLAHPFPMVAAFAMTSRTSKLSWVKKNLSQASAAAAACPRRLLQSHLFRTGVSTEG